MFLIKLNFDLIVLTTDIKVTRDSEWLKHSL